MQNNNIICYISTFRVHVFVGKKGSFHLVGIKNIRAC